MYEKKNELRKKSDVFCVYRENMVWVEKEMITIHYYTQREKNGLDKSANYNLCREYLKTG